MQRSTAIVVLAFTLLLGGCGDGNDDSAAPTSTSTSPAASACEPQAFLPVLKAAFDNTAEELRVVRVDVRRCRNGYAQVVAVPDTSVCKPGIEHCYDSVQVWLRLDDGEWKILNSGTGISCEDTDLSPTLRPACRALGYPVQ
jgi:hypothetical protein